MRPITDGMCPESLLPCNDLPKSRKSIKKFLDKESERPNPKLIRITLRNHATHTK